MYVTSPAEKKKRSKWLYKKIERKSKEIADCKKAIDAHATNPKEKVPLK